MINIQADMFPKFPVYVYNPGAPMLFSFGSPRSDGWRILFIPRNVLAGGAAHWTLVNVPHAAPSPVNYVYFGHLPLLSPNIYWHSPQVSPDFMFMKAQNMACNCMHRCMHEPLRFALATVIAFDNLKYNNVLGLPLSTAACYIEPVSFRAPYSRGPNNALIYTCGNYQELKQNRVIFENTDVYPLVELVETPLLTFHVLHKPGFSFCFARMWIKILATVVLIPLVLFLMISVEEMTMGLWAFTIFVGLLYNFVFGVGYFVTSKLRPGPPSALSKLWLPPSLSCLPFSRELQNRCAIGNMDRSTCRSILKRLMAQNGHFEVLNPHEVEAWLDNVSSSVGETVVHSGIVGPPIGVCLLCLNRRPCKRLRCALCRKTTEIPFEVYDKPRYVGLVPLVMQHPKIPNALRLPFRVSTYPHGPQQRIRARYKGKLLTHMQEAIDLYEANLPALKAVGMLAGPMWLGVVIRCFPRSIETAIVAFAGRMAAQVPFDPEPMFWDIMFDMASLVVEFVPLEPWREVDVVSHQRTRDKRVKIQTCYEEMDQGVVVSESKLFTFGMFPKGEKHAPVSYGVYGYEPKIKLLPRLINNPSPFLNALMAPYILPMAKWFASQWNCNQNLFYAGCSPPSDINLFLQSCIPILAFVIEDDVSMMDGSQTLASQNFFQHIASRCYSGEDKEKLLSLMVGCSKFTIKRDDFSVRLQGPNASGVPPTSLFNSMTTGFARLFALIYAVFSIRYDDPQVVPLVPKVIAAIKMAVAGDDGLLVLPAQIAGQAVVIDAAFLDRYSVAFSWAGFDVGPSKIRVFSESNWRLSTFLAMRPYWSGDHYEYGVEIARRMKSMFWLYDKAHHPIAWARGVCVSLLAASKHVPVVRDICDWYLATTRKHTTAVEIVSFTNPYSSVYGYTVEGDICERTIVEFCSDYQIPVALYQDFRRYLWSNETVLVNLEHPLLHTISQFE